MKKITLTAIFTFLISMLLAQNPSNSDLQLELKGKTVAVSVGNILELGNNPYTEQIDEAIKIILNGFRVSSEEESILKVVLNNTLVQGIYLPLSIEVPFNTIVEMQFYDEEGFSMLNQTEPIYLEKGINYIGVDASIAKNGIYFFEIKDQDGVGAYSKA